MIEPFEIAVPASTLNELRERLRAARWPLGVTDSGGVPLDEVRSLCGYWLDGFDWQRQQDRLNALPHFRARVEGHRLHFVHLESAKPEATPLLLLHGWPGSFSEMLGLIPLLKDSFHLVVPSLPGFGFSDVPKTPGMSNRSMADLLARLMADLGYERFAAHGGDVGAGVATWLARRHEARLVGIHLNYIPGSYAPDADGDMTPEEEAFIREGDRWAAESGGYGHVQRTRPLTLAYGLSDSPIGLLAWIAEKFREWAAPASDVSRDELLTNVTIYWVTNTVASSVRLYLESAATPLRFRRGERLAVPCGVARFPHEAPFPPRSWVERVYDVRRWTDMPRGGHFAALEEPRLLAEDIVTYFDGLREKS